MGKIFGIALVFVMIGAMLPLGGFGQQNQALAQGSKTWYVDDDLADYPDADFTSIQEVVDAASDGDTIMVYDGIYQEHVTLDKSVILETDQGVTIDGGGTLSTVTITADGCLVSGFNITGSGSHPRKNAGVRIDSDHNTISGNTISGNKEDGVLLVGWLRENNTIANNLISENKGSGLYMEWSNLSRENTIEGNTILGNSDYGIYLSGHDNILRDNVMNGNGRNFGISYDEYNDIDTSNTVDGKPIYYLVGAQDDVIDFDTNAGCVIAIDSENITVKDSTFTNNSVGVCLCDCRNCLVDNVIVQDNDYGIYLDKCSDSTVQNCTTSGNEDGLWLERSDSNALCSNHIEDNSDYGICLSDADANVVTDSTIQTNGYGITLWFAYDNVIESNEVLDNDRAAIRLLSSDGNLITGNTVRDNTSGIDLMDSCDCRIEHNFATQNKVGVEIYEGCGNLICGNTISANGGDGVLISYTKDNDIHHNNLIDNEYNAWTWGKEANSWDDGSEGNYWSDYEERYPDAEEVDGTGIWNTPYQIPGEAGATDGYPLMEAYGVWDPWAYDGDESGFIEIDELLDAINDYIGGDLAISELLEVINLYISHTPKP